MSFRDRLLAGGALLTLGLAGFLFWRFFAANRVGGEQAYFYDLSEQRLFVASRDSIPPIRGLNDATADGVRAVVISRTGKPSDRSSHGVAYLETCTPALKQALETARQQGVAPALSRSEAQSQRLVRRPADADWHAIDSPEGERIVTEWAVPGPEGITPVVCTP